MKKETKQTLPKQYAVGGQQMIIKEVDNLDDKLGNCCVGEGTVNIAKTFNGIKQSDSSKKNTLWHEVVHSILDTMGETELSRNEKFVCTFSGFLTEVLTTMK